MPPVSVCHQVSTTGQRPPPMWLPVPDPRLGVDRLADRAEQPQARQVVGGRVLRPPLHEGADGGRRRVEDRDLVALDDRPPTVPVGVVGRSLVHHARGPVGQRPVDDVAVAGDPPDVGGAPVDVGLGLEVEDRPVREGDLGQVTAGGVHDPLRAGRRAGGVEDEEQVLGIHRLGGAVRALAGHQLVPPVVPPVSHDEVFRGRHRGGGRRARSRSSGHRSRARGRRSPSARRRVRGANPRRR